MIYFTADLHFGHANILKPGYSARPFLDVDEMNEQLVTRWNARVQEGDEVWLLGDVALISSARAVTLVKKLRGRKHLIRGNHDHQMNLSLHGCFETVRDYYELKVPYLTIGPVHGDEPRDKNQLIVLSHYPFATWNKAHYGSWCLHGHSHGNYRPGRPNTFDGGRILDVGVDCHDYTPVRLDEIAVIMARKQFRVVDHHGAIEGR